MHQARVCLPDAARTEAGRMSSAAHPFGNPATGRPPTTDPFAPCGICGHDPKNIVLDAEVWMKIVWAAKDSEDWQLRILIEQAVMGPKR
jgi:hypothetical protein